MTSSRIVIFGGAKTGKTEMAAAHGAAWYIPVYHTDDAFDAGLSWSAQSDSIWPWFDRPGPWIIEGTSVPRALRKWRENNPRQPAPVDEVWILTEHHEEQTPGQRAQEKGIFKVWGEIEKWVSKVARIRRIDDES